MLATLPGSQGMPTGNSDRTAEIWINSATQGSAGGQELIGWGDDGASPGNKAFEVYTAGPSGIEVANEPRGLSFVDSGAQITNGRWHLIDATYRGRTSTVAVYVDGSPIGSMSFAGPLATMGGNLTIGGYPPGPAPHQYLFTGGLADAAVYDHALTPAQVAAHYRAATGNPTITEFSGGSNPISIAAGPDGNLWFSNQTAGVGHITPAGAVTGSSSSGSDGITAGPDGNLWFTTGDGRSIGRVTPAGSFMYFSTGSSATPTASHKAQTGTSGSPRPTTT